MSAAMDKKKAKVAAFLEEMLPELPPSEAWDQGYIGWFYCFNTQHYYEAHDVLECLWHDVGAKHPNWAFYKGLIQVAGAFVHMKLAFEHPQHRIHGERLGPATRLFALAKENLTPYCPSHDGLDVAGLLTLCEEFDSKLHAGKYRVNPWRPDEAPQLAYPAEPTAF